MSSVSILPTKNTRTRPSALDRYALLQSTMTDFLVNRVVALCEFSWGITDKGEFLLYSIGKSWKVPTKTEAKETLCLKHTFLGGEAD